MSYTWHLSKRAESYIGRLRREERTRIVRRLDLVAEDPYDNRVSQAASGGTGKRKTRVGNLRILFYVEEQVRVVEVTEIRPRGDVYKHL